MEYKGIMFCSGEVGRELTPQEIEQVKKEIDAKYQKLVEDTKARADKDFIDFCEDLRNKGIEEVANYGKSNC